MVEAPFPDILRLAMKLTWRTESRLRVERKVFLPVNGRPQDVVLHPSHDGGMSQRQAALGYHLHQVLQAQLEPKIPLHAQQDDLTVKSVDPRTALPGAPASPWPTSPLPSANIAIRRQRLHQSHFRHYEVMRIMGRGNVGIGTTTVSGPWWSPANFGISETAPLIPLVQSPGTCCGAM